MSTASALSNRLEQEASLLRQLNDATLCVQAAALGDLEILGIGLDDVKRASEVLSEFLFHLIQALEVEPEDPVAALLIKNIKEGPKPEDDWKEEIKQFIEVLSSERYDSEHILGVIEDLLSLLAEDYSEGVKALYYR